MNSLTKARAIRGGVKLWWFEHSAAECRDLKRLAQDDVVPTEPPILRTTSETPRLIELPRSRTSTRTSGGDPVTAASLNSCGTFAKFARFWCGGGWHSSCSG